VRNYERKSRKVIVRDGSRPMRIEGKRGMVTKGRDERIGEEGGENQTKTIDLREKGAG
jgi:hypothetical protein